MHSADPGAAQSAYTLFGKPATLDEVMEAYRSGAFAQDLAQQNNYAANPPMASAQVGVLGGAIGAGQLSPGKIWQYREDKDPYQPAGYDDRNPESWARTAIVKRVLARSVGRQLHDVAQEIVSLLDAMTLQEAFQLQGRIDYADEE